MKMMFECNLECFSFFIWRSTSKSWTK